MTSLNDTIAIRRATLADVGFIRKLAMESVVHGIPTGRDIPNETVAGRVVESLKNLELLVHRRREVAILVAVDQAREDLRVGYLILEYKHLEETTGEMQSHIYDMAVVPEYMGRFIAHLLVREAARVSHQQGYRYMSAVISASNRRALLTALKMGFEVERIGIVMACGAEGIAAMPGRPAGERAHDLDRAVRRQRRRTSQITPGQESTP